MIPQKQLGHWLDAGLAAKLLQQFAHIPGQSLNGNRSLSAKNNSMAVSNCERATMKGVSRVVLPMC